MGGSRLTGVRNERLPRDHEHLATLDDSMSYLWQSAPTGHGGAVRRRAGNGRVACRMPGTELYAAGTRKVSVSAPVGGSRRPATSVTDTQVGA